MEFLEIIEIIFIVSAIIVFILTKVKIPSLVGFLIAGILIGPYSLGFVTNTHNIEIVAEVGIVLLLFSIGIEFSLKKLLKIKRIVFGSGFFQILLTTFIVAFISYYFFKNLRIAIFTGVLVSLSSTASVLKILSDKSEIDTAHGKTMLGILIFQDLFVVIIMLIIPILSGSEITIKEISTKILKAIVIIAFVLISSRFIFPNFLHQIVKTKSRELFIITMIVICLGIAIVTSKAGLSLALGAFLAGLIISESEYASQALSDILPFKESFMGLFFVSVGMLIDIRFVYENIVLVVTSLFLIIFIKSISIMLVGLLFKFSQRVSIISAIGLSQIGEFSFVLAYAGKNIGLIGENFYHLFLSVTVITMILTPFMINISYKLSENTKITNILKKLYKKHLEYEEIKTIRKTDHVIIIGFGLNGRNLARVLKESKIPYVILEMNNITVLEFKKKGEPIYYGDGTSIDVLHALGIDRARVLVIAISDPSATRRIVSLVRNENQKINIIVRTRYVLEVDELLKLGANEVIPEEFETSIEIFARVLKYYHFPSNLILNMVENIRQDSYKALRRVTIPHLNLAQHTHILRELEVESYLVTNKCSIVGKSIRSLEIRKKTNVTVIAIKRGENLIINPNPDFEFMENDIVIFVGKGEEIKLAINYFNESCGVSCTI